MNGYKTFRNGCAGKRVYLNRKEAARTIERYHTHDKRLQPYRCSHCRYWHLGHGAPMHFKRCVAQVCKLRIEAARYALQALRDIASASHYQPEPVAIDVDNRVISLIWEHEEHWLELQVDGAGIGEWFYWNRALNISSVARYVTGEKMPLFHLTKHLHDTRFN
jgi:hypothetical protein